LAKTALGHDARRIPRWAMGLIARLSQDQPAVLSRSDIGAYLIELGDARDIDETVTQLVRLGWLRPTPSRGVWAFRPLGDEAGTADPYLPLRAWQARDPQAVFALAGEAAAWHLGYLDRRFTGPVRVWVPDGERPPFGARSSLSIVRLRWAADMGPAVRPSRALLRRRGLDLTRWASGLPAFGPEALLAQLSIRPSSFTPWVDLADHLDRFVGDCEAKAVCTLLADHPSTVWQRAAYLAHMGGNDHIADVMMERRGDAQLPHLFLGTGSEGMYSARFNVTDRLVAPYLAVAGKA
jgi:hypothetical protein